MTTEARQPSRGPVGIVVIGRNEGERLHRCLASVARSGDTIVYVDSGSTDGSVEWAHGQGIETVILDAARPFTAARGRNEGLQRLAEIDSDLELIQFIDGDCELIDGWLESSRRALEDDAETAVVCGRVRERRRDRSIYNRLCDIEFDRPAGEVSACGGIFMARRKAFEEVGGFNGRVVAGEESEFCFRLRRAGWKIVRLDEDMTWHDAAIFRFGQWWRRMVRGGHAYAQNLCLHGRGPERMCVRESSAIWFWAIGLPLIVAGTAWPTQGWSLLLLLAYPLQVSRIAWQQRRRLPRASEAWQFALFCTLAKFPQAIGQMVFGLNRLRRRENRIIEYKGPVTP